MLFIHHGDEVSYEKRLYAVLKRHREISIEGG